MKLTQVGLRPVLKQGKNSKTKTKNRLDRGFTASIFFVWNIGYFIRNRENNKKIYRISKKIRSTIIT